MQQVKGQRIHIWAFVIFTLAFVLRLFHIAAIYKISPFFDVLPGDLGAYDRWAREIIEHGWLGNDIFYQDPLYPYFLAFLYKVVGRDFFWIYVIQAFLGAITSLLLVGLGNRIFSKATGIFAGMFYALYGPAIFYDGLLLKVTLSAFLFTLAIYLFLYKDMEDVGPSQFFSGFFIGLACLTRANFFLILPIILVTLLVNKNTRIYKKFGMLILFIAGVASALTPVIVRNYVVGNELVLTTAQAGQNFYIGHNPDANGTYIKLDFVRPDPLYEQEDFKAEAERRTGRKLSPSEVSRYWMHQGIEFIQKNPLEDIKLTGKKLLLFINDYETPDNHNLYFHQRYSKILQNLPFSFGLIAPFFLLGLLGMLLERRAAPSSLFCIQAAYIVSVIIFYVFSRYRMVALPIFCLSAGYGLSMLQNQFRTAQWQRLAASLIILACGFWLANFKIIEPFDFSHSFTDEGIAYEIKNDEKKALRSYEQALEINPDYLRAWNRLGKLQLQQREYKGARKTFTRILELDPGSVDAKYQIMRLDKLGL